MLLAWVPALPLLFASFNMFRGISAQKATGPGAIAAGFAEAYMIFGLALTLMFEVTAIFLLVRTISKGTGMRTVCSVFSICFSGLILATIGISMWLLFVRLPPGH